MSKKEVDLINSDSDEEIFEYSDFSTATPLEKLSANIEQTIKDWIYKKQKNVYKESISTKLRYDSKPIKLVYYFTNENVDDASIVLLNTENDFPSKAHHLRRWFGVSEFLIISSNTKHHDESDARVLLSALIVAVSNLKQYIPCFVTIGDPRDCNYIGHWQTKNEIVKFHCDTPKPVPNFNKSLSGIVDVFKDALKSNILQTVQINARYTYILEGYQDAKWKEVLYLANHKCPIYLMKWGTTQDPIDAIHISCRWDIFTQDSVYVKTELIPEDAVLWNVRCVRALDSKCELTNSIRSFIALYHQSLNEVAKIEMEKRTGRRDTVPYSSPIFSQFIRKEAIGDFKAAVRMIFSPDLDIEDIPKEERLPKSFTPGSLLSLLTIQATLLNDWEAIKKMWNLFVGVLREHWETGRFIPHVPEDKYPDWSKSLLEQKLTLLNCCISKSKTSNENKHIEEEKLEKIIDDKDEEKGGLGWNFLNLSKQEHLPEEIELGSGWQVLDINEEVKSESQQDKEESEDKKSEEINKQEEASDNEEEVTNKSEEDDSEGSNSEDEEFFDVESDDEEEDKPKKEIKQSSWTDLDKEVPEEEYVREGALKEMPNTFLIKTGKPMYIPITQDPPPMTEDMISQQQEVFANLGSSKEATLIRARMQSATLLSDMQSFKSANPGCILEDFLIWYSPKDIKNKNDDPQMSTRMSEEENLWKKTWAVRFLFSIYHIWKRAKPIPAHKQKPLFDHVREAELVLHYFETLPMNVWMQQLLIGVFVTGYYSLRQAKVAKLAPVSKVLDQLKDKMNSILSYSSINRIAEQYEDLCLEFEKAESLISFATSLYETFGKEMEHLIVQLCTPPYEIETKDEDEKSAIQKCITGDLDFISEPDAKEYILRCVTPRPYETSKPSPQKMFVVLSHDVKICTAFSTSIPF